LTILNDILDFSKIEAGKIEFESITCNIHDLLDSVGQLFATKTEEKGLDLHIRYESNAPEWVKGDPARIRQVLTNLMGNAVKFTETGYIILSARLAHQENDNTTMEFEVDVEGIIGRRVSQWQRERKDKSRTLIRLGLEGNMSPHYFNQLPCYGKPQSCTPEFSGS